MNIFNKQKENTKISDFLKEYGELVAKHKVDFVNFPMFVPGENGEFKIMIKTEPVDLELMEKAKKGFISK